jgi:hypothetical protein
MPILLPPSALHDAYCIMCQRVLRAYARGAVPKHRFTNLGSKKCKYCTSLAIKCLPVSLGSSLNQYCIDLL